MTFSAEAFSSVPFSGQPPTGGGGGGGAGSVGINIGVAGVGLSTAGSAGAVSVAIGVAGVGGFIGNTFNILVRCPYLVSDTIGTKTAQLYQVGSTTPVGSAITTGYWQISSITNAWYLLIPATPNGANGEAYYTAVFSNINGSQTAAIEVYGWPAPATTQTYVIDKVAPFLASQTIGTAVAQTLTLSATTGTGVTATAGGGTPFAGTSADVGKFINSVPSGTGRAIVTAAVSTTVCTVTVIDAFTGTSVSSSAWSFGIPGWQQYNSTGSTSGSHSTAVTAIPGVVNGYSAQYNISTASSDGGQYGIDWDTG